MRIKPKENYPWLLRWLFRSQRKRYGQTFIPSQVWGRSPKLLACMTCFWAALIRKSSPIEPNLRALICTRVSQIHKCAFCIDLHSSNVGDPEQLAALAQFQPLIASKTQTQQREKHRRCSEGQESPLFSRRERIALEYIENRSDELFSQMREEFSDDEIVELTGLIAFQTCSATFNTMLDLPAQGFHT